MSKVIEYLEAAGRNPALPGLDLGERALAMSGIDDPERQALLACDPGRLNALLGGRREMKCLIFSPDDEG